MIIKPCHALFWSEHQPHPSWMKLIKVKNPQRVSVHECINAHADEVSTKGELAAHNLLYLCKSWIRRSDLLKELLWVSENPGTIINPEKRKAFAKKWAARIRQQRYATV